jgi:hypothetical protein
MYDREAVAAADTVAQRILADLLSGAPGPRGVHGSAPAGAGKSELVTNAVGEARENGLRVVVGAPTNDQAVSLVSRIARRHCGNGRQLVTFVPAQNRNLPADVAQMVGVRECTAREASRYDLIVGTLDKLGNAFGRGDLSAFDLLIIDESYQADAAKYYAVGDLAPLHLLVGDAGQISPFSTVDDPFNWRGLPENPLQTAVGVLRRNHPGTAVHHLPITRRLDGRAAAIARLFYRDFTFAPAVLPGIRKLRLTRPAASARRHCVPDQVLDRAGAEGWAHVELPRAAVLQADPDTVDYMANLVHRLFERQPHVRCERQPAFSSLRPGQVAVGVSHNDQKDLLRVALDARGLEDVVVETANKLQGLEYEVVFVWHPLAGLPEADEFHLDPGRLCVLLTRHRQACIVVGRVGDRDLLADQLPPPTPAYLGWDPDPVLDGWEVHADVFAAMEAFSIEL